jgi:hypothetical protein
LDDVEKTAKQRRLPGLTFIDNFRLSNACGGRHVDVKRLYLEQAVD